MPKSLREMPRGRAYADRGKVDDRYKGLTQQELAARVQQDIAPYFGNAAPKLDPQTLRHHPWKKDGMPTTAGFNIPVDVTDEEVAHKQRRYRYRDKDGRTVQLPLEKGTINTVGNQHPRIWAHEVRHNIGEDGSGEVYNRLADAATAQDDPDWEAAVYMWRDKLRRENRQRKVLPSEAQTDLVEKLQGNNAITPRNIYAADYERGARIPGTEAGWWQKDDAKYTQKRAKEAKWTQEANALADYEAWNVGLSERNAKRKAGQANGIRNLFK